MTRPWEAGPRNLGATGLSRIWRNGLRSHDFDLPMKWWVVCSCVLVTPWNKSSIYPLNLGLSVFPLHYIIYIYTYTYDYTCIYIYRYIYIDIYIYRYIYIIYIYIDIDIDIDMHMHMIIYIYTHSILTTVGFDQRIYTLTGATTMCQIPLPIFGYGSKTRDIPSVQALSARSVVFTIPMHSRYKDLAQKYSLYIQYIYIYICNCMYITIPTAIYRHVFPLFLLNITGLRALRRRRQGKDLLSQPEAHRTGHALRKVFWHHIFNMRPVGFSQFGWIF